MAAAKDSTEASADPAPGSALADERRSRPDDQVRAALEDDPDLSAAGQAPVDDAEKAPPRP